MPDSVLELESFHFFDSKKWSFSDIWDFQKNKLQEIVGGRSKEAIIYCEHESLFTKGRRYQEGNLLGGSSEKIPTYEIERGGDITWHGPGQLVVYPILRLQGDLFSEGLHEYLRFCEQVVIDALSSFGLGAGRFGPTGVWVDEKSPRKIASIGIAVRRWVTYHGISINVSNSFEAFDKIRPCNFDSKIMTSLEKEGVSLSVADFMHHFDQCFRTFLAEKAGRVRSRPSSDGRLRPIP